MVIQEQDPTLRQWTRHRDAFLNELLRLEGLHEGSGLCRRCPEGKNVAANLRCNDCTGGELVCADCCVGIHKSNPFHRIKVCVRFYITKRVLNVIQKWNGSFYEQVSLAELGLVIQLGHLPHKTCPNPEHAPRNFVVIHTNGFHSVRLRYCQCNDASQAGNHVQQLLRHELYPASIVSPTTCCTMRMLEHFHMLTLQSKITAYDYYHSLEKLTDNIGLLSRVVSY